MERVFLEFLWRGISVGLLIAAAYGLTSYCRRMYRAAVLRRVWILLGLLLLAPVSLPGLALVEVPTDGWMSMQLGTGHSETVDAPVMGQALQKKEVSENAGEFLKRKRGGDTREENAKMSGTDHSVASGMVEAEEIRREIQASLWKPSGTVSLASVAAFLWIVGVLLSALWEAGKYFWWRRRMFLWNRSIEPQVWDIVKKAANQVGTSVPKTYRNKRISSPILTGWLHPVLLLPEEIPGEASLYLAVCHECMHKRKKDLWVHALWTAALCLHWYQPLVRLGQKKAGEAMEFACDEAVMEGQAPDVRISYGKALLFFAKNGCGGEGSFLLSFSRNRSQLGGRLHNIFRKKEGKGGTRLFAMVLAVSLAACNLISCASKTEGADFEKTDELVICFNNAQYNDMPGASETHVNNVITYFKAQYPEVEVKLEGVNLGGDDTESEAARKRLKTEIMAGNGPDLLISAGDDLMENPEKQMETGLFCDLNPYLERSQNVKAEDLNSGVLACGQSGGSQYLMPLDYFVYHMLSAQEELERYGFQVKEAKTREGFLAQAEGVFAASGGELPFVQGWSIPGESPYTIFSRSLWALFPDFMEDENGVLPFANEEVRQWFQLYRSQNEAMEKHPVNPSEGDPVCGKDYLFADGVDWQLIFAGMTPVMEGKKPVYLAPQKEGEGLTAKVAAWAGILDTAKNKQNAWNFLELMLSQNSQRLAIKDRYLPVRMDLQEELYEEMDTYGGNLSDVMSQSEREKFTRDMAEAMTNVKHAILSDNIYERLVDYFTPYVEGEASYEECAGNAQKYYDIYRTE